MVTIMNYLEAKAYVTKYKNANTLIVHLINLRVLVNLRLPLIKNAVLRYTKQVFKNIREEHRGVFNEVVFATQNPLTTKSQQIQFSVTSILKNYN